MYLWNAGNGAITQLVELENPDEYISAVSWIKEGNILAVGNSTGSVQVRSLRRTFIFKYDIFCTMRNGAHLSSAINVVFFYTLSFGMLDSKS